MAQIIKKERKIGLKASPEKHYNFWKHNIKTFSQLFPNNVKMLQILEGGTQLRPGCTIHEHYFFDKKLLSTKLKVKAMDDARKSISFEMVEGDALKLYRSFRDKFEMGSNYLKWSVEVENASHDAPDPELYLDWLSMLTKGIDSHLSQ